MGEGAGRLLSRDVKQQNVRINRFTFVGWAGAKLKLGVNDKEDYFNLISTEE